MLAIRKNTIMVLALLLCFHAAIAQNNASFKEYLKTFKTYPSVSYTHLTLPTNREV